MLGVTMPPLKHFGPLLVVWGAAMFLLFFIQDLGSSLMYFGGFLALLYVATNRLSFVTIGLVLFAFGAWGMYQIREHIQDRVAIWLHPFKPGARRGPGLPDRAVAVRPVRRRAVRHGLRPGAAVRRRHAAAAGGRHRPDLRRDRQRARASPGACGLLLVYLLFCERGMKVAMLATDSFSKLLAAGLTAVFALQVFVIVGGVTKVIPLTGVTLPFVSYGGSSIVANFVLLALLLLISDRARRPAHLR